MDYVPDISMFNDSMLIHTYLYSRTLNHILGYVYVIISDYVEFLHWYLVSKYVYARHANCYICMLYHMYD